MASLSRFEHRNNIPRCPDSVRNLERVLECVNSPCRRATLVTYTRARRIGSSCIRNDVIPADPEILVSVNPRVGVSYRCFWICTDSSGPSDMQGQPGFLKHNTNRYSAQKRGSEPVDLAVP
jgi:hypothetical protein